MENAGNFSCRYQKKSVAVTTMILCDTNIIIEVTIRF